MTKERRFDEEILLRYKETEDPELFEQILNNKDIKRYTLYVCNQKLKNYPTSMLSIEDFKNIADLVLWQCILKYRFICPVCGLEAKTEAMYKLHTITKHGEYHEPRASISRYIKFNLGAYLQNELRKEYSVDRQANLQTTSLFSPMGGDDYEKDNDNSNAIEYELSYSCSQENDFLFENSMDGLMCKFDSITREVFYYLYKLNMKQVDIAIKFFEDGKYSSEQSAKVVISRIIKNKIKPVIEDFYNKN